ncbi:hypothetical protein L228DRAFT_265135 [Xylona heveae TC161]|uniref:Uncharacterized protein n=1 Tax=Xylona heveae (strain CBS 132557 / TC161) TaxID=1328760 RepID=A0A165JY38_XYLHT|nr:hypothetical protein L228DRAFT_265135 [Xylona heveae TC161]KZF26770.1 hypothetical protein L228DRAFT_265135 [Xylona heveae TC161]
MSALKSLLRQKNKTWTAEDSETFNVTFVPFEKIFDVALPKDKEERFQRLSERFTQPGEDELKNFSSYCDSFAENNFLVTFTHLENATREDSDPIESRFAVSSFLSIVMAGLGLSHLSK